jgi:hypothetical protein
VSKALNVPGSLGAAAPPPAAETAAAEALHHLLALRAA